MSGAKVPPQYMPHGLQHLRDQLCDDCVGYVVGLSLFPLEPGQNLTDGMCRACAKLMIDERKRLAGLH